MRVIFCILILSFNLEAQVIKKDTFLIKIEYKKICQTKYSLTCSGGKYYFNGSVISKERYLEMDRFAESICDSLLDKASSNYCKFYNKDSIIVEEGIWHREYFEGIYKEYYDNGVLKTKGYFSQDGDRKEKWFFYDKRGKLNKTIDYK
ncbi:MAG: hypothetical protein IM600_03755 [Bacteroidetes bacterium]|nr:hypothetical protein [Bacteroidota bacterium]MCA6442524.1 hypothetical protein [Bacteroidota bacterium]